MRGSKLITLVLNLVLDINWRSRARVSVSVGALGRSYFLVRMRETLSSSLLNDLSKKSGNARFK